jgi:hypothetical protein
VTRLLLRTLNFPALVLVAAIGIALQTSLFASWPLSYLQPDAVLLLVIWSSLRRGFIEGGLMTLVVADLAELHSAAPQGLFLIGYMVIFLAVRAASRVFVLPSLSAMVIVTLIASVSFKLCCLGVLHLLGASANQWRHTVMFMFPTAVIEGALSIWAYRWLERFDWLMYRTPRGDQAQEEELQLEGEAL